MSRSVKNSAKPRVKPVSQLKRGEHEERVRGLHNPPCELGAFRIAPQEEKYSIHLQCFFLGRCSPRLMSGFNAEGIYPKLEACTGSDERAGLGHPSVYPGTPRQTPGTTRRGSSAPTSAHSAASGGAAPPPAAVTRGSQQPEAGRGGRRDPARPAPHGRGLPGGTTAATVAGGGRASCHGGEAPPTSGPAPPRPLLR